MAADALAQVLTAATLDRLLAEGEGDGVDVVIGLALG